MAKSKSRDYPLPPSDDLFKEDLIKGTRRDYDNLKKKLAEGYKTPEAKKSMEYFDRLEMEQKRKKIKQRGLL